MKGVDNFNKLWFRLVSQQQDIDLKVLFLKNKGCIIAYRINLNGKYNGEMKLK